MRILYLFLLFPILVTAQTDSINLDRKNKKYFRSGDPLLFSKDAPGGFYSVSGFFGWPNEKKPYWAFVKNDKKKNTRSTDTIFTTYDLSDYFSRFKQVNFGDPIFDTLPISSVTFADTFYISKKIQRKLGKDSFCISLDDTNSFRSLYLMYDGKYYCEITQRPGENDSIYPGKDDPGFKQRLYSDPEEEGMFKNYFELKKKKPAGFYIALYHSHKQLNYFFQGRLDSVGNKTGTWTYFYKNGKIRSQGQYKNDKLEGLWSRFYKDGRMEEKVNYKNGEKQGRSVKYHDTGQVAAIQYYNKGISNGLYLLFFVDSGKPYIHGYYLNGEQHGPWKDYTMGTTEYYEHGKLIKTTDLDGKDLPPMINVKEVGN